MSASFPSLLSRTRILAQTVYEFHSKVAVDQSQGALEKEIGQGLMAR